MQTGAGEAAEQRKIGDVTMLAQGLRALLQLDLFGFDLVLEKDSLRSAVIDVNPFPSKIFYPSQQIALTVTFLNFIS